MKNSKLEKFRELMTLVFFDVSSKQFVSKFLLLLTFVLLVPFLQERDGFGGVVGRRGRGDCNMGGPGGLQEVTYAVPADKCGLVIGKGKEHVFIKFFSS